MVGGTTALASLATTGTTGTISVSNNVTTTGTQTYTGGLVLADMNFATVAKDAEVWERVIRKVGADVILSPRPRDWRLYFDTAPVASDAFMAGVEDLPVQERER